MAERPIKIPGPDHPIKIEKSPNCIVVMLNGHKLAETDNVLTLFEARYPAVHYIPHADVDMTRLARTANTTYCPFKGDCSYYSLPSAAERGASVVWTYEVPFAADEEIRDHMPLYPDRVQVVVRTQSGSEVS